VRLAWRKLTVFIYVTISIWFVLTVIFIAPDVARPYVKSVSLKNVPTVV